MEDSWAGNSVTTALGVGWSDGQMPTRCGCGSFGKGSRVGFSEAIVNRNKPTLLRDEIQKQRLDILSWVFLSLRILDVDLKLPQPANMSTDAVQRDLL